MLTRAEKLRETRRAKRMGTYTPRNHSKDWHAQLKIEAFAAYGGAKCARCGRTDGRLVLDHIYEDGRERRANGEPYGWRLYHLLKQRGYPQGDFQVLCNACNGQKSREYKSRIDSLF